MSEEIAWLRETGLVVYAGVKKHVMEGGSSQPVPWPVAYILIRRGDADVIQMLVVF